MKINEFIKIGDNVKAIFDSRTKGYKKGDILTVEDKDEEDTLYLKDKDGNLFWDDTLDFSLVKDSSINKTNKIKIIDATCLPNHKTGEETEIIKKDYGLFYISKNECEYVLTREEFEYIYDEEWKEGDVITNDKITLEILGVCGKIVFVKEQFCNHETQEIEFLKSIGFKLKEK